MDARSRRWLAAGLVLWATAAAGSAFAQPAARADVRVVIDVSGSMKQNDPQNLRRPALRLLVGLLPPETRAGVWTFGRQVNMVVPFGPVDQAWKEHARAAAAKIHSRGLFTHIEAAIVRATTDWTQPDRDGSRHLILLTDGVVDVSKAAAESAASRERILGRQLPRLRELGAHLHTIALSANADRPLLEALADGTGGWSEQVDDAESLERVFLRIFEQVAQPDTLPLEDNRFVVDPSISELTLLVFRRAGAEATRIRTPSGRRFDADSAPDGVRWHRDESHDLLTVTAPEAGEWSLVADVDPDNRVMILSDLQAALTDLPVRLLQGEAMPAGFRLLDGGETITRGELLAQVDVRQAYRNDLGADAPHPLRDDGVAPDDRAGDGVYDFRFGEGLANGRSELVVTARSPTFARELRRAFEVVEPGRVELTPADEEGMRRLVVTPDPERLVAAGVVVDAVLEAPDGGARPLPLLPAAAGVYEAHIDTRVLSGSHRLRVGMRAETVAGNPLAHRFEPLTIEGLKPPEPTPPVAEPRVSAPAALPAGAAEAEADVDTDAAAEQGGDDWLMVALGLLVANLLLFGTAAGIFVLLRRRRPRESFNLVDSLDAG